MLASASSYSFSITWLRGHRMVMENEMVMTEKQWRSAILGVTASVLLAACGGGESDSGSGAPAPSSSPPPPPPVAGGAVNTAPTIAGSPTTDVVVGSNYQ